ncbi:MAG: hypothetical protein HQM09_24020, partial [Candidatus Riflebacteria bacterium]|nr:hypothetical protein [Candidatus Riflebacteria bacterium]
TDFADVKTILTERGLATIGFGIGRGDNRIEEAAQTALQNKLIEKPLNEAQGYLFWICVSRNDGIFDIHRLCSIAEKGINGGANIVYSGIIDESLDNDTIALGIVATGFPKEAEDGQTADRALSRRMQIIKLLNGVRNQTGRGNCQCTKYVA